MMQTMFLAAASFLAAAASVEDVEVHMLSFNIRTSLASADAGSHCSNWDGIRKQNVINNIKTVKADFVGTQETSDAQKSYLDAQLAGTYSVIGESTGHLNGMANEWNAVYYRSDTWKVLTNGMFWLGTDPNVMSAGWGMVYYRTCVWGRFQHIKTGASICVLNTHYETPGNDEAQKQGSNIILEQMKSKCDARDGLIVLMGDFNALKSYPAMQILFAHNLIDPSDEGTFCGDMLSSTCSVKYDFTLFRAQKKDACHLESEISRISYNGCYPSDHAGLVGSYCLQGSCCSKSSVSSGSEDSFVYEDRIASDSDSLGKVKGSNFSSFISSQKTTKKSDSQVDKSDKASKTDADPTDDSPESAQTIAMSSGGGDNASTTVGIVLSSLGVCCLVALVVVRRKGKLEREAHLKKSDDSSTTGYFAGSATARAVSDTSALSPLPPTTGVRVPSSPIPELVAAPRDTCASTTSSISVSNSEMARHDDRYSEIPRSSGPLNYISSRRSSGTIQSSENLEFAARLSTSNLAIGGESNTLANSYAQSNLGSSTANKADCSERCEQAANGSDSSELPKATL